MQIILQVNNLTKSFGGLMAVNGLSLVVQDDSIHALIGPNGSGKTTTINLLSGVLKADNGDIIFENKNINQMQTYEIARMGMIRTFQNLKLFNSMTVIENVMIGGHSATKIGLLRFLYDINSAKKEEKSLRERAEEVLEFIGLYNVKDETVKNLPYGKQKMVELGRTLMNNPKLLLLDEPAAGLNPTERQDLVKLLEKLFNNGTRLFLIEHNMDVVMNICKRITVLNFGKKIAEGSPKEIQENEEVIKAYLGDKYKKR
ncbi:ABC transporter ATP-binding protein [Thermoanaerobacteraceae bacterium SP2]|nr:ABC transporter ATP-binding protein [Thermoanaerobacteraceae bacterium SP2]